MGGRLTKINSDGMGEGLYEMNPFDIGKRLPEINPDELILNCDRSGDNDQLAHQSDYTSDAEAMNESIIEAIRSGLYSKVLYLIDQCVDLQYIDYLHNNLLHILLDSRPSYPDKVARDRWSQCVMTLLEAGVDVNHVNEDQDTPITIAAREGLYKIVIYLIDHCAYIPLQYNDEKNNNILHLVLNSYRPYFSQDDTDKLLQCVIKLAEAGINVNHLNIYKHTPIIIAARQGLFNIVKYLIDHCTDKYQNNVLHIVLDSYVCCRKTDALLQCVMKLVEVGVDVNHLNQNQETPIVKAARNRLYKVLMYMLGHGARVDCVDRYGQNILHHVLFNIYYVKTHLNDRIFVIKTLIKMGVDVNKPDVDGNTPLFNIVNNRDPIYLLKHNNIVFRLYGNLITELIYGGCNVNHQNKNGQTPLMYYIRNQADISILKLVIPLSDVNLTDNNGDTACSYCVQYYLLDSTNIFKLYPPDVLISPNNGVKLFHQVLTCKRLELFNYYIELKLIVKGVTTEGENMLHLLARVNYDFSLDKFKWLFYKRLDINYRCSKTNTPIMIAALLLNIKYLELFTCHPRIDINAQNNQGHTALHLCIIGFTMVKGGLNKRQRKNVVENYCRQIYPIYMECVDSLLAVGINVNTQDGKGRTALMMAAMKNDRFLIRKLLNAGALVNCNETSALQYLDIYESMFDLSFKLLISAGDNMFLNLPCINGSTLIQETLRFPRCWDPHTAVSFIKYLVGENCCLQSLVTSLAGSSYNQIDMRELSSQERNALRKLLYLGGAPENEIVATLNFEKEDTNIERDEMRSLLYLREAPEEEIGQYLNYQDRDDPHAIFQSGHRELFSNYCCNISLKSRCRRIIRQKLGLGIKEKVMDLELPRELNNFLQLKDVLHPKYYNIDNIDDGCNDFDDDDGYGGYDIGKDRDDDYSQKSYQYFTLYTDNELRHECVKSAKYPNSKHWYKL